MHRHMRWMPTTVLDFRRGDLQHHSDVCIWQVLPNVLEAEISECQQADFAFELGRVQAYF